MKRTIAKALGNPEPCSKHGTEKACHEYELFGEIHAHYFCQLCEKEKKWEERRQEGARRLQAQQEKLNNRLENAMIAPRFQNKTLSNWMPETKAQREVLMKAKTFAHNFQNSTGLIMVGKPGTGKNHLACGVVQECIRQYDMTALVTTAFKIVRRIKESWFTNEESKTLQSYRDIDLLWSTKLGFNLTATRNGSTSPRLSTTATSGSSQPF